MPNQDQCYLCKSKKLIKRSGTVRDMPQLDILECASCGLVFLSSFDHIKDGFYENSGIHGEKKADIQAWIRETYHDDERRFEYLKLVLPNRKLLDFGCGVGGFLLKARNVAAIVHGIEAESRLNEHFHKNDLFVSQDIAKLSKAIKEEKYDIIAMFHVLEHIPDPKTLLNELSELLTDNGQILIEVPNANDALLTLYKNEAFSNFTYWSCHLFLYTSGTLQMLFDKINLKVNYIKQIQRYPLSNHLYWLSEGKPCGHQKWHFMDSSEMHTAYEKQLAAIGKCDTIIASISKK